ncbi:MAG: hypothetical protein IKU23_04155 [Clostridia bacterium]|nr:hypothetical protein [Clostridia bacterium]MBR5278441.1 hypothetical protein [Clostridia bacterium]
MNDGFYKQLLASLFSADKTENKMPVLRAVRLLEEIKQTIEKYCEKE